MNKYNIFETRIELQKAKTERCYVCSGKDRSCDDYVAMNNFNYCLWRNNIDKDLENIKQGNTKYLNNGYLEELLKKWKVTL